MKKINKVVFSFICIFAVMVSIIPAGYTQIYASNVDVTVSSEAKLIEEINNAEDGVEKHIQIDTPIAVTQMIIIPANKDIVVSASFDDAATLTRDAGYTNHIFAVEETAVLKTENIILDGERDTRTDIMGSLVFTKGKYVMGTGTVLKNNALNVLNTETNYMNYTSGAGIFANGLNASVTVNDGLVTNNYGKTYSQGANPVGSYSGGGIATINGAGLYVNGGVISYNETTGSGGGIFAGGETVITGGTIDNNTASVNGGGIVVYGWRDTTYTSLKMSGGTITNNTSGNDGGGIHIVQINNYSPSWVFENYNLMTAEITGGLVESNTATRNGGGVAYGYTDITIGGSVVINQNSAKESGGGVSTASTFFPSQGTDIKITGGTYSNNTARTGGAIQIMSNNMMSPNGLTITGGAFIGNNSDICGGAVEAVAQAGTTIIGTSENPVIFKENTSVSGGAILARGNTTDLPIVDFKLYMENVLVEGNEASFSETLNDPRFYGTGGGLAIGNDMIVELKDVTFTKNTADSMGGAIANDGNAAWTVDNQLIISGNTQIGVDKNDNGIFLDTYAFTNQSGPRYTYQYFQVSVKETLGSKAHVNVEEVDIKEIDESKSDVENKIGRLLATKLDGTEFSESELMKFYYQGLTLFANLNEANKKEIVLDETDPSPKELKIVDDYKTDDGIVVILRTGDTGETTGLYPTGYPSQYKLKLTIDGTELTSDQLSKVTWDVENDGGFRSTLNLVSIDDGSNIVKAKQSGVVKLTATYEGATADIYVVIPGDMDRNGRLSTGDAARIFNYTDSGNIEDLGVEDKFTLLLADMNGDGRVTTGDPAIIFNMSDGITSPSN